MVGLWSGAWCPATLQPCSARPRGRATAALAQRSPRLAAGRGPPAARRAWPAPSWSVARRVRRLALPAWRLAPSFSAHPLAASPARRARACLPTPTPTRDAPGPWSCSREVRRRRPWEPPMHDGWDWDWIRVDRFTICAVGPWATNFHGPPCYISTQLVSNEQPNAWSSSTSV